MPSSFPNSIDNFTDPLATSPLNSPSHSLQHANLNSAVNKIETYMGLVLISNTTIGSAVSSVTVSNCFNSTYDDYKIIVRLNSGGGNLLMNFVSNGSTLYVNGMYQLTGAGATTNFAQSAVASALIGIIGSGNVTSFVELSAPNLAIKAKWLSGANSNDYWWTGGGNDTATTQYTSLSILTTVGTLTGGTISVYGYRKI